MSPPSVGGVGNGAGGPSDLATEQPPYDATLTPRAVHRAGMPLEEPRAFDWASRHDPASYNYPAEQLTGGRARRVKVEWDTPKPSQPLDQHSEPGSVGFAWTNALLCGPWQIDLGRSTIDAQWPRGATSFAFAVQHLVQQHDAFPGTPATGTSLLTAAKCLQATGYLHGYRWAFGAAELRTALLLHGPVVLGMSWYSGMMEAAGGEVRVTGERVGGHAVVAVGYDPAYVWMDGTVAPAVKLLNSWGANWGVHGCAWIRESQLSRLLEGDGEACVPILNPARSRVRVAARRVVTRFRRRSPLVQIAERSPRR